MKLEISVGPDQWRIDVDTPVDVALPVHTDGSGTRAFYLDAASSEPVRVGAFVGDVRLGGSVNCETLHLRPHGNGTHTECVGHIVRSRVSIASCAPPPLLFALVLRVTPVRFGTCKERYLGNAHEDDLVVTRQLLEEASAAFREAGSFDHIRALCVATRIPETEVEPDFSGANPPYFTVDAIDFMLALGVEHLLTDLPSLDKENDGGGLCAHRQFWSLPSGATDAPKGALSHRTVTELCAFPAVLSSGFWLLSLQVPALCSDAAPSRPVLFALKPA